MNLEWNSSEFGAKNCISLFLEWPLGSLDDFLVISEVTPKTVRNMLVNSPLKSHWSQILVKEFMIFTIFWISPHYSVPNSVNRPVKFVFRSYLFSLIPPLVNILRHASFPFYSNLSQRDWNFTNKFSDYQHKNFIQSSFLLVSSVIYIHN